MAITRQQTTFLGFDSESGTIVLPMANECKQTKVNGINHAGAKDGVASVANYPLIRGYRSTGMSPAKGYLVNDERGQLPRVPDSAGTDCGYCVLILTLNFFATCGIGGSFKRWPTDTLERDSHPGRR